MPAANRGRAQRPRRARGARHGGCEPPGVPSNPNQQPLLLTMTRPATLALVALALLVPAQAQTWERQYPSTFPDLLDVATDGAGVVVAVGNDGVVLRSTDSGLTWTRHGANTGRLAAVEFVSPAVVLAGGDGLFRSVDGGVTYAQTHPVTGVQSIEVVGASNAWAVTQDGFVLRSTDGGASWALTPLPTSWFGAAHAVSFETPTLGWIVGHAGMLQTTDGGATWSALQSPTNWALFGAQRDPGPVKFLLEDSGTYRGNVNNWTFALFPWVTNARDFHIVGNFGLVVGLSGRIMYSPNNGVNWLFAHDDGPYEHEGVVILDPLVAIVVGEDGRVLRTDDGGTGWTVVHGQTPAASPWVRGLAATDNDTLFAACTFGKVLRTDDAGATWTEMQAGTTGTHFRAVDSFDGVNVFAVGERQGFYPTFCYSNDGGLNWTELNGLGMYDYYDVDAISGTEAFAASETRIWRTTNAGASWLPITPFPHNDYHAIDFPHPTTGFAAGTGLVKSVDGGVTWSWLYNPPSRVWGMDFVDQQNGWIVGDGGMIQRTTNGGLTWTPQVSGTTQSLQSVTALTPSFAFAAGINGVVLMTIDGGATWTANAPSGLSSDPVNSVVHTVHGVWIGGDFDAGIWHLSNGNTCATNNYCTGKVHSLGGVANMRVFGAPSVQLGNVGVGVMNALPNTLGVGFRSDVGPASAPLWGGTLCVQAPLTRLPVLTFDPNGFAYYNVPMNSTLVGTTQYYQVLFRDVNAPDGTGIGMTDGVSLRFCP